MGRHEKPDYPETQPDKDQGGDSKPPREPWKDRGHDEEVRDDRMRYNPCSAAEKLSSWPTDNVPSD
jgi:hypothetical protein